MSAKRMRADPHQDVKRALGWIVLGVAVVLGVLLFLFFFNKGNAGSAETPSSSGGIQSSSTGSAQAVPGVTLPFEVPGVQLTVRSLFQSTVLNPDADGAPGEDVASLEVENTSGRYMKSARLTVELQDGTTLEFLVEDLPAGRVAWVFEVNNTKLAKDAVCADIFASAEYGPDDPMPADTLAVEVDGTTVTIRNLTDETLQGLTLVFKCLLDGDDVYFGGASYTRQIDSISPGESATLEVDECYLGTACAVRFALAAA